MTQSDSPSKGIFWAGWILTGLVAAFLLLDSALHFSVPPPVVDAFSRLGIPLAVSHTIAILLLASVVLYLIPNTSVLGAILITGYLGGAIAIHLRAGSTPFEIVFPAIFAALAWTGIWLREPRLRALLPLRD